MYTRCPSCRAEISFEPPANAASLPEGYKHRIKCPACGVTIGVKLPRVQSIADIQPSFTPANPNAFSSEPIYRAGTSNLDADPAVNVGYNSVSDKKTGRARTLVMMIFSLLFVAINVVAYLVRNELITGGFAYFDGIFTLEFLIKSGLPDGDIATQIVFLLPALLFLLAGVNFIVNLGAFIAKKYSRLYTLIVSVLIGAIACALLFYPVLYLLSMGSEAQLNADYFKAIIDNKKYLCFVPVGLGVLQFIFSLIFLKSLKKKA